MKTLLKGGRVLDPLNGTDEIKDILIEDGRIAAFSSDFSDADKIINCEGLWVAPGLIDLHAHFREPGQTHKEDMESGAKAAVAGGFTTVCVMPNTTPPLDNAAAIEFIKRRSGEIGLADILPIGAISLGMKGLEVSCTRGMKAAGAAGISEDGFTVKNAALLMGAMETACGLGLTVFSHCEDLDLVNGGVMNAGFAAERLGLPEIHSVSEDVIIARDIILAEQTGCRLHICHVSTALGVQLVREAKARGVKVTAEACPHHFILSDEDIPCASGSADPNFKMNPPLRSKADVAAVRAGLADGTVDAIATDHAPHHTDEKAKGFLAAPFGIVGLETALPLAMELVTEGVLTPLELVRKMSLAPSQILGAEFGENKGHLSIGAAADITVIDPTAVYKINTDSFKSKSKNTPFVGRKVRGKVEYTIIGGEIVYGY